MIARAVSRSAARRWFPRALETVGRATLRLIDNTLLFTALGTTVVLMSLRPGVWRGPVRMELQRRLRDVTVRSLATTAATGVLIGFALVAQAVYWLAVTGEAGLVGPVIVVLLIREIVPILVGLILFGRSGTATLIELGEARTRGWFRLFEMQGLDPLIMLVLPRVVAFTVGAFCLATVLLLSTLGAGYVVGHALSLIAVSAWDFADQVLRAMTFVDFVVPPLKCLTIGFLVGLTCCATGLGRHDEADELQRLVPRGFVRAAFAILVVNSLFDLVR